MGETWFGHYRLDRLLGSGGTGQVWRAHDSIADRVVALKVLSATVADNPTYRQRFTREARLAAQVRGPHLAAIHAFGEFDGRLYLDMEFIAGTDLATLLRREGQLSPARAVAIVVQIAQALDAAHRAGMVHRDVKPANIMVDAAGLAHLIDFGTAYRADQPAITTSSNVVGTLAYMAPERFVGAGDARSDQYALACVLYECLTAQRPFGNGDAAQSLHAHLMTSPPLAADWNLAVPAGLDAVITRGMAKVPEQRCASASEFASAAYAAITGLDVPTVETAAVARPTTAVLPQAFRGAEALRTNGSGAMRGAPAGGGTSARTRSRVSVAVLAALLVAVSTALWLGRPGAPGSDSAAPTSMPTTTAAGPSSESRPEVVPAQSPSPQVSTPVRAAPVVATAPVAWQPCDPAVDARGFAGDGTPLQCVATVSGLANWLPAAVGNPKVAAPKPDLPKPDPPKPGREDSPGNGNGNGHGKHGNDK
ncbi:serine/threonine-protein kinase [Nocardia colli]|uniref:serine/threonine-protein kinase n=1 Tax=Nocardia colli TaxID=2545717 RepID=UPI0035DF4D73